MQKDIKELWQEINDHPEFIGGAIFVTEDLYQIDPDLVDEDTLAERMIVAGWGYLESI